MGDSSRALPEPVVQGKLKSQNNIFKIMYDEIVVKNFNEMKTAIVNEVIVPRTMDWLHEIGINILDDLFKTNIGSSSRKFGLGSRSNYPYDKSYRGSSLGSSRRERRESSRRENDVRDWEEVSFDSRTDAERVISSMMETIRTYQTVSIADLFSFSGVDASWADNKYGWANLEGARAIRGRDGRYYLDLPEPLPIDDD